MWRDENGQGLVEYALIIILVVVIILVLVAMLGPMVMDGINSLFQPTAVP
ncbi:MAG TPA: pilus assembly protein [Anaerolineales bacterium]|nr:pilus assembly protein [Anaerolineales bacterium]